MSETKFTKGEWAKRDNAIGIIDDSDTQSYGMIRFICHVDKYDFESEWQANAHLIATAPDMYKELDKLLEILNHETKSVTSLDVCRIEKLLAKARGEQQ